MDPVSLSGLGLGATSLAIQLFDGLRKSQMKRAVVSECLTDSSRRL